jgi:hypothetical protein
LQVAGKLELESWVPELLTRRDRRFGKTDVLKRESSWNIALTLEYLQKEDVTYLLQNIELVNERGGGYDVC